MEDQIAIFGNEISNLTDVDNSKEQAFEWLKMSHVTGVPLPTFSVGHGSLHLRLYRYLS